MTIDQQNTSKGRWMFVPDDKILVSRWWLQHVQECLLGALPSGRIGDCVFLLRDQIGDILAASPSPPEVREIK